MDCFSVLKLDFVSQRGEVEKSVVHEKQLSYPSRCRIKNLGDIYQFDVPRGFVCNTILMKETWSFNGRNLLIIHLYLLIDQPRLYLLIVEEVS